MKGNGNNSGDLIVDWVAVYISMSREMVEVKYLK